jgi:hypothetical protein
MSDLTNKLAMIQQKLKAPKGQVNTFGKYKYRSCEDILEAVKPLLADLVLTISDDIVEVGGRVYVKATASLSVALEPYRLPHLLASHYQRRAWTIHR